MTVPAQPPLLLTIPASDRAFGRHVAAQLARLSPIGAPAFEARLRRLFPRAVVRERGLSDEPPTWYIYREGRWLPDATGPWWAAADTPAIRVSDDGWVTEANHGAGSILGIGPADRTHHYTDLLVAGTTADAAGLFGIVLGGETLDATVLLRQVSGEAIAVELHAEPADGAVVAAFRLAEGVDIDLPGVAASVPILRCEPESDPAFRRYADLALARMAEPTPEGLELRLRRLYPHAHVGPGPEDWLVRRDGAGPTGGRGPSLWWTDASLPRVVYDAQALIHEANPAVAALLGQRLVGRHWQEFVTAGTTEQVSDMLAILAQVGAAESRFRMPGPDGSLVEFDSFTTFDGECFTTVMRPRP